MGDNKEPEVKKDSLAMRLAAGIIIILFLGVVCFGILMAIMFIMGK